MRRTKTRGLHLGRPARGEARVARRWCGAMGHDRGGGPGVRRGAAALGGRRKDAASWPERERGTRSASRGGEPVPSREAEGPVRALVASRSSSRRGPGGRDGGEGGGSKKRGRRMPGGGNGPERGEVESVVRGRRSGGKHLINVGRPGEAKAD